MKASTILIIGAAGLAIVYIVTRSSSSSLLGAKAPASTTAAVAGGAALGGLLSGLFGGGSSSASKTGTASAPWSAPMPTQVFTETDYQGVAASDDATGVVGFGGWD